MDSNKFSASINCLCPKEVNMGLEKFFAIVLLFLLAVTGCVQPGGGGGGGSGGSTPPAVGSIAGQGLLPERVQLDSDTRDPNVTTTSNNSLALAQPVANLVMVVGNADSALDSDDYYATSLNAGETIKLTLGDQSADLDLYLYQSGGVVASSTGAGNNTETVISPGAGTYKVRVQAVSGNSNYQLQIGSLSWSALQAQSISSAAPKGDVAPGEVLVKLKNPEVSASGAVSATARSRADGTAKRHHGAVGSVTPQGVARVVFDTGVMPGAVNAREEERQRTLDRVKEMQADPEVEYAEPNYIVHATAVPNDTYWAKQWNMRLLNLPAAWDLTIGSSSVIVAVVDTGVLYNHPDLAANILKDGSAVVGYDFILSATSANDGDGPDPDPYDSGDQASPTQSSYHGTHVSGIIGAASNNGTGVAGVNWNVRIMPVRVLGKNNGTSFDVAEGIKFAAGVANSYGVYPKIGGVTTPADIINLSLGSPDYSQTIQDAINLARTAGVTVVAAAGNDATSALFYPAACTGVIAVSAVGYAGTLAPYSNFGSYVDIAAPGGDTSVDLDGNGDPDGILSTLAVGLKAPTSFDYVYYQGTSMASPHVAGVIALMKAYHNVFAIPGNKLTPDEIDSLIRGTAPGVDSITNYPLGHRDNNLGYGLLDAAKAVLAAKVMAGNTAGLAAELALDPIAVDFGFSTASLNVSIVNHGVLPLTGITVSPYAVPWLSHTLSGQVLTLNVDRSGLADGSYQTTLTVNSTNGGSQDLVVKVSKGSVVTSNIGQVYFLLVGSKGQVVDSTTATLGETYLFHFYRVKKGLYQIVAGTDLDNDGYIGDTGEFFGVYASVDNPQTIDLSAGQNLSGRNFVLEPVVSATAVMRR